MSIQIQIRRDVSSNWTSVNPVLADGELAYDKDNANFKIGNGVSSYTQLPDLVTGGGGGVAIAAGGSTNTSGTVSFGNANGFSFVTSNGSVVGSYTNGGGGVAISAGTNSTATGTVAFANSNGVTFGMNTAGVVTASHDGLTNSTQFAPVYHNHQAGIERDEITNLFPAITEGTGTFTVASGSVWFFDEEDQDSMTLHTIAASGTLTPTNDVTGYVCADRDTDTWVILNDQTAIDYLRYIPYFVVFKRTGSNNLHTQVIAIPAHGETEAHHRRILACERYARESGYDQISVDGSGNVTSNGGVMWSGNVRYIPGSAEVGSSPVGAITSATRQFFCYHSGGVWAFSSQLGPTLNNTQYDDGTDLQTLGSSQWVINYIYRGVEDQDHSYAVLSNAYNSLEEARAAAVIGALPELITSHAVLIGRIIVLKDSLADVYVESAFTATFAAATPVTIHNDMTGLQGGQANQYYHLNQAAYDSIQTETNVPVSPLTVTYGTLVAGTYSDLAAIGGTDVQIGEAVGTNALQATINFSGITKVLNHVLIYGYYSGGSTHNVAIEIWNYTSSAWEILGNMAAAASKQWYSFTLFNGTDYSSAGAAQVRFRHLQNGVAGHNLYLDYVVVERSLAVGGGVVDHGALAGLGDDDHPQYQLTSNMSNYAGTGFTGTNISGTVNSNGIALSVAGPVPSGVASLNSLTGELALGGLNGNVISIVGSTINVRAPEQSGWVYLNGNTTVSSRGSFSYPNISFSGAGGVSIGFNTGASQMIISAPVGGGGDGYNIIGVNGAGTALSTTIQFSNSNNITFGLNAGTITASASYAAQTVQTQGMVSVNGSTGNISITAGSGTSGGSMSVNGSSVTFGVATNYSTNWTNITSNAFNTSGSSNFVLTANSSLLQHTTATSAIITGRAGLGTTFNGANISGSMTVNTAGVNLSMSVAAPGAAAENNWFNLAGNTLSNSTASGSTIQLVGGNNITLAATNGSQIHIIGAAGGAGGAGTQFSGTNVSGTVDTNGISLSVAAPGGGAGVTQSRYYPFHGNGPFTTVAQSNATIFLHHTIPPVNASFSKAESYISIGVGTTTSGTRRCDMTVMMGIYTYNNSTLSLYASGSQTYQVSATSNATSSHAGIRVLSVPISGMFSAGVPYVIAHMVRTSNLTSVTLGPIFATGITAAGAMDFGVTTNASIQQWFPGQGCYATSSGSMPQSIRIGTDVLGTVPYRAPWLEFMNQGLG